MSCCCFPCVLAVDENRCWFLATPHAESATPIVISRCSPAIGHNRARTKSTRTASAQMLATQLGAQTQRHFPVQSWQRRVLSTKVSLVLSAVATSRHRASTTIVPVEVARPRSRSAVLVFIQISIQACSHFFGGGNPMTTTHDTASPPPPASGPNIYGASIYPVLPQQA